jgi:hypothetical protein
MRIGFPLRRGGDMALPKHLFWCLAHSFFLLCCEIADVTLFAGAVLISRICHEIPLGAVAAGG